MHNHPWHSFWCLHQTAFDSWCSGVLLQCLRMLCLINSSVWRHMYVPKRRYMRPPYFAASVVRDRCGGPNLVRWGRFPTKGHPRGPGGNLFLCCKACRFTYTATSTRIASKLYSAGTATFPPSADWCLHHHNWALSMITSMWIAEALKALQITLVASVR